MRPGQRTLLQDIVEMPYAGPCMHEFVASARRYKRSRGVRTLENAKLLSGRPC
jgi:glycine cleavage system protein P-like pyridoxal-binding family